MTLVGSFADQTGKRSSLSEQISQKNHRKDYMESKVKKFEIFILRPSQIIFLVTVIILLINKLWVGVFLRV